MPTRIKNRIKYTKFFDNFPKFNFGSLLVSIFLAFLIVIATFSPIPLMIFAIPGEAFNSPVEFFANLQSVDQLTKVFYYIPQVPIISLIAAILGPRIGLIPVILYIIAGLFDFPVFASGGGLEYLSLLGFGYILGFLAGIYVTGRFLSRELSPNVIIIASLAGVLAVHIIGSVYLTGMLLIKHESVFSIFGWIWQLSGMQILYDFLFAVIAVFAGRFLRKALWIAMD